MNEPAKPPLQLQPDRYYRADDGHIYGPIISLGLDNLFSTAFCCFNWKRDGSPALSGGPRLLEEAPGLTESPETNRIDISKEPLSLEEGGYYRADNGITYGPLMRLVGSSAGQNVFCYGVKVWNSDGSPVWDTVIRLVRKVEKPPISSGEAEKALRGKTSQELDDAFRDYVASLNGAISKGTSPTPDRSLLLTILTRSKERLAFFEKEAADETWRFHKQAQGKCDELEWIIEEIENHFKKHG